MPKQKPQHRCWGSCLATQLNSDATHLHRRTLRGRYHRLVVAVFGRRGQANETVPAVSIAGPSKPIPPDARVQSSCQRVASTLHGFAIVIGSIRTHETSAIPKAYVA